MTDKQRAEILEVCGKLLHEGYNYAYVHNEVGRPVYSCHKALSEIERILANSNQEQG